PRDRRERPPRGGGRRPDTRDEVSEDREAEGDREQRQDDGRDAVQLVVAVDEQEIARTVAAALQARVAEEVPDHVVADREPIGGDEEDALAARTSVPVREDDEHVRDEREEEV